MPLVHEHEAAHQRGELAGLEGHAEHGEGLLELGALHGALQYCCVSGLLLVFPLKSLTAINANCSLNCPVHLELGGGDLLALLLTRRKEPLHLHNTV